MEGQEADKKHVAHLGCHSGEWMLGPGSPELLPCPRPGFTLTWDPSPMVFQALPVLYTVLFHLAAGKDNWKLHVVKLGKGNPQ